MAKNANNLSIKSRSLLVALEPRLVFDGALALTDPTLDNRETGSELTDLAKAVTRAVTTDAPAPREASARREIVFIDDSVAELSTLIKALGDAWDVVQVRHGEDGLAQINAALAGRGTFDAIHNRASKAPNFLGDGPRLSMDNVTVNEGSPWMVFTLTGSEGQPVTLGLLTADTAVPVLDTATALEVYDGSAWVPYIPGSTVTIPGDGDSTPEEPGAKLLVRVAVKQDSIFETSESVTLAATSGKMSATAVGTILDDGTGSVFGTLNTTGVPDTLGTTQDPSLPAVKDDDRPLSVSNDWVYESAGFASFTVSGAPGQPVTLGLANGTATAGD